MNELSRIDLNLLVVFATVMREGSTVGAGRRLNLTQSAISQNLRRLRTTIDDPLFVRERKGIIPTNRAEELYAEVLPSLRTIADALRRTKPFVPVNSTRTFHIRNTSIQSAALMPALLTYLRRVAPSVQMMINVGHSEECATDDLERNEIDVLIAPSIPDEASWLRRHDFADAPFMCIYDGDRLGIPSPITKDQFIGLPHLIPPAGYLGRGPLEADLRKSGVQRDHGIMTNEFYAIPIYLKTMNVIASAPLHAAAAFSRQFGLTMSPLPVDNVRPYRHSLYWHVRRDTDPGHKWLRDVILATMVDVDHDYAPLIA
jgi:DNA-binding transcriptional LysR family regulator